MARAKKTREEATAVATDGPRPETGGAVICSTCKCEFGVNPETVPAGTRLACPVCRTPC